MVNQKSAVDKSLPKDQSLLKIFECEQSNNLSNDDSVIFRTKETKENTNNW